MRLPYYQDLRLRPHDMRVPVRCPAYIILTRSLGNKCQHEFCYQCSASYEGDEGMHEVGNSAHATTCRHYRSVDGDSEEDEEERLLQHDEDMDDDDVEILEGGVY